MNFSELVDEILNENSDVLKSFEQLDDLGAPNVYGANSNLIDIRENLDKELRIK